LSILAFIQAIIGLPAAIAALIQEIETLTEQIRQSNNAKAIDQISQTDAPKAKSTEDFQAVAKQMQNVQKNQ